MGFGNVLFSYGADWHDEDNNVLGVVNSPEAVSALELYKGALQLCSSWHEQCLLRRNERYLHQRSDRDDYELFCFSACNGEPGNQSIRRRNRILCGTLWPGW